MLKQSSLICVLLESAVTVRLADSVLDRADIAICLIGVRLLLDFVVATVAGAFPIQFVVAKLTATCIRVACLEVRNQERH